MAITEPCEVETLFPRPPIPRLVWLICSTSPDIVSGACVGTTGSLQVLSLSWLGLEFQACRSAHRPIARQTPSPLENYKKRRQTNCENYSYNLSSLINMHLCKFFLLVVLLAYFNHHRCHRDPQRRLSWV